VEKGMPPLHVVEQGLLVDDNIHVGLDLASVRERDHVEAGVSLVSYKEAIDNCRFEFLSQFSVENGIAGTAKDPEVSEGGLGQPKQSKRGLVVWWVEE
jgi:hypothetical protein